MKKYVKQTLIVAMMAALAALVLTACGGTKLNLKDYTEVTFSGAQGYGRASVSLNEDQMLAVLTAKKGGSGDDEAAWTGTFSTLELLDEIDVTLDKTDGLSNGDKVTITVSYPEKLAKELGIKLSPKNGSSWTVKVSDLPDVESKDLFEDLDVSFTGPNGYGQIEINNRSEYSFKASASPENNLSNGDTVVVTLTSSDGLDDLESYCINYYGFVPTSLTKEYTVSDLAEGGTLDLFEDLKVTVSGFAPNGKISVKGKYNVDYECSKTDGLSNGDTVTITAKAPYDMMPLNEYCATELQGLPMSDSYTYTVTGLDSYITKIDDIPADLLTAMQAQAEDVYVAQAADDGITLDSYEYQGCYFLQAKNQDAWGNKNKVYLVYKLSGTGDDGAFTSYSFVQFSDLEIYADGTPYTDLSSYQKPSSWDAPRNHMCGYDSISAMVNKVIDNQRADYTVETNVDA